MTLKALLVATDFSAPAQHALLRAGRIARESGARLELLHVLEQSALNDLMHFLGQEGGAASMALRQEVDRAIQEAAEAAGQGEGASVGTHVTEGHVLEQIAAQCERLGAELLVMGARGEDFMRPWPIGSTAERMLRKTTRSLLAVKQVPHEAYRRVLVPVDFSAGSAQHVAMARRLAPQAELCLFHAFEVPYEGKLRFAGVDDAVIFRYAHAARDEAEASLAKLAAGDARCHFRAVAGRPAASILRQEEELGADLIVLGKHGADMIEELLLGSVTKHVLAEARCDVLVSHL